jgi:hypothetical protein
MPLEKNRVDNPVHEREPSPELRRRGKRRGAGADTPSGPDTQRSVKPAKREQAEQTDREHGAPSGTN